VSTRFSDPSDESSEAQDFGRSGLLRRFLSLRTLLSFLVAASLLALTWILADLRMEDIASHLRAANPLLIVAAYVVFGLTFPVRTLRWRLMLTNAAHREQVAPNYRSRDLFQILYISWFVNAVVPAKLGDIYRAYMARANYGTSLTRTLGTVFSERVLDVGTLTAMVLVSAGVIVSSPDNGDEAGRISAIAAIGLGLLVIGVIFLLFFGKPIVRLLPERASGVYERFHSGVFDSWTWRTSPWLWLTSIAVWSLEMVRLALVMRALGVVIGPAQIVFVGTAASLLLAVPTPGGLGAVESGLLGLSRMVGVGWGLAGAIAIVDRLITYWSVIVTGGLVFVFTRLRRQ
jgi:uncharacterized membrane protein YbhN (UPF0104 family)